MSQEQLAEQLHISRQAVSKWEMGQSTPDIDTCVRLCEVLKVPGQKRFPDNYFCDCLHLFDGGLCLWDHYADLQFV